MGNRRGQNNIESEYITQFDTDLAKVLAKVSIKSGTNNSLFLADSAGKDVTNNYFREPSTASRILEINDFYKVTNALSDFIYLLYSGDTNDSKKVEEQNEFLKNIKVPSDEQFWFDSYWQLDNENKTLRKEGEKRLAIAGEYYRRQIQSDKNAIDKRYIKVNLISSAYAINVSGVDGEINYSWIYGKYSLNDDFLLRIYFTFKPDADIISKLLKSIQHNFDSNQIPFEFKFLSSDKLYYRFDTGVLYLSRRHWHISMEIVREIYFHFVDEKDFFREEKPLFTYQIAKGISFAENPDDFRYSSFGSYVSVIIAKAIIESYPKFNTNTIKSIIKNVKKFYKNPNSQNVYNFNFIKTEINESKEQLIIKLPQNLVVKNEWIHDSKALQPKKYLFTAIKIANKICKEAIWNDGDCNWVSCNGSIVANKKTIGYKFSLLDDSLADGRLGVALFLAYMYYFYSDITFKRTINGALNSLKIDTNNSIQKSTKDEIDKLLDGKVIKKDRNVNKDDSGLIKIELSRFKFFESDFSVIVQPLINDNWRISDLTKLVHGQILDDKAKDTFDEIISNYFNVERPFGNMYGNDEFNPTLIGGYAMLGYIFLRLYDIDTVPPLPFKLS